MEVDWIYLAEVSVLWRALLNRVITNFEFLTCQNCLGCLCHCQPKRTCSVHCFACSHLQWVSCSKMYDTCALHFASYTTSVRQHSQNSMHHQFSLLYNLFLSCQIQAYHSEREGRIYLYLQIILCKQHTNLTNIINLPTITLISTLHRIQQSPATEQSSMQTACTHCLQ